MKNIHTIFEKTAEYEPYAFAKVNTVLIIWQPLPLIWLQRFVNMFEHRVLIFHEK